MKITDSYLYVQKVYSLLPKTGFLTEYSGELGKLGDCVEFEDRVTMEITKSLPLTTPEVTIESLLRLHPGQWKRFAGHISLREGGTGDFIYDVQLT